MAGGVAGTVVAGTTGSAMSAPPAGTRHTFRTVQMGTEFRLLIEAADAPRAAHAAERAWRRLAELDKIFSDYRSDSEARRLAASAPHAEPVPVSRELWTVCRFAQKLARETGGAFDVTVGPLSRLWRRAHRLRRLPRPDRLAKAREATGYRHLVVCPDRPAIQLRKGGMRLDFGGIAKGYALDEIRKVLTDCGITVALIDGGGDVAALDAPPGEPGWPVRLREPGAPDRTRSYSLPPHWATATSGDRYRFVVLDGKRYSHLVDPRTGQAVRGRHEVTVLAPSAMEADALASACCLLTPEAVRRLLAKRCSVGAWGAVEREPGTWTVYRAGDRASWFDGGSSRSDEPIPRCHGRKPMKRGS